MSAPAVAPAPPTAQGGAEAASEAQPRRRVGVVIVWVAVVVVVVFGALLVWAAASASDVGEHRRSPVDPGPRGAMALAEVLRAQGVEVTVTNSFGATASALGTGAYATLVLDDDWWVLTEDTAAEVLALGRHIVVVQPSDDVLAGLAPGVEYAGFGGGSPDADCELGPAQRAGRIAGSGDGYTAPASATACYVDGVGNAALVRVERGVREVTVLGTGDVLTNERITEEGNAALALGLLGEHPRVVWYQPDVDDYALDESGLAARQADWYVPLIVLLLLVGVAAALWRGRRMGPVVVEDLPVEVRSSETMEGRARLYERGGARDHALGTLRAATIARLARTLGLGPRATADEVIAASAAVTERDPASVDFLLRGAGAPNDSAFVGLSDNLLRLERDVARAVRPD
ncbi:MAG: DUF4350 domain-containing protein [Microbacteriaceae bacterium]|nr:MAG: DUF4350 domain-containing protein [Microbacteriaceae bacterium]